MKGILEQTRKRVRLVQLLDAAERSALTPISMTKLHSFAYLADILSPVWGLEPFDVRLLKTGKSPFFPDFQLELDRLVAMGIAEVSGLAYKRLGDDAQVSADYSINFRSEHVREIIRMLKQDVGLLVVQQYLDELAGALASLPDEDIANAAAEDAVYSDPYLATGDVIDFAAFRMGGSRTARAVEAFGEAFPHTKINPSQQLYMYAHYLGRRANAGVSGP